jgi:hypothetical protein
MPTTTRLYLVPPPVEQLTPAAALDWLDEWAAPYVKVVACGMQDDIEEYHDSYEMLSSDVANLIDACMRVVKTSKPERLAAYHERSENELSTVMRRLAEIVASRPKEIGNWADVYDQLAQGLVELLAGREAA